jgi:hypothetical protein
MRTFEVGWAARQEAAAKAKRALVEGLKPKPHVPASEVIPWDEREAERIRGLIGRPRKPKRTYEHPVFTDEPVMVFVEPRCVFVIPERPEPIRFSVVASVEFEPAVSVIAPVSRSKTRAKNWRRRQWNAGVRNCAYCEIQMTMPTKQERRRRALQCTPIPPTTATVDHRHPLALGGDDEPHNWVLCCNRCNGLKADMPEATFRAMLARDRVAA